MYIKEGRVCPYCIANELQRLRYRKIQNRQISEDFSYLFPQLASIYYAGKFGLNVITDSDELIGAPVTALIPDISLAIDVCCSKKIITISALYSCIMEIIQRKAMRIYRIIMSVPYDFRNTFIQFIKIYVPLF